MNKTRKLQDFAEDFSPSQSNDMEELPQGDGTSPECAKAVKKMSASADTITKHAETIGLVVDGIGRYLLNEDGTVRDFTNVKLMNEMGKKVDDGLAKMNACGTSIDDKIKQIPTTFRHDLSENALEEIKRLNRNLRIERIIFVGAFVLVAIFAAFVTFKGFQVADKSEKMTQWYEDNNESILFGRYLRVNENERWRFWHEKWAKDPGLKEDMNDYFLMEELKENRKK